MDSSCLTTGAHFLPLVCFPQMVHKALLQLDETGEPTRTTKEAPLEVTSEPLTVKINRPFIILMFDGFTWSTLLIGKIMNPA